MRSRISKVAYTASVAAVLSLAAGAPAALATTISSGPISLGLFDNAGLGSGGVGVNFAPVGDAITPGCLCEGWGVAANGDGAHYVYGGSPTGFSSAVLSAVTPSSATSTVTTTNGLIVTHDFTPVGDDTLYRIDITIMNNSGAPATNVRYARTLDWDVPPGHFSDDFTTIFGGPGGAPSGNLFHTSTDPFAPPNPMVTRTENANTNVVNAPGDLGSYFIFAFGDLGIGESLDFTTYIGAASTTAALLSAFSAVGVEAYSYSFDNDGPATFGYGFEGVGLPPINGGEVPEPAALGLLGLGLVGLAGLRRRKVA